jgi:hypothetical protein
MEIPIWTATTYGDKCPITTTAHVSKEAAETFVRNMLPRGGMIPL